MIFQPYAQSTKEANKAKAEEEEIIYILQLPDWEFKCPLHDQVVKTPRCVFVTVRRLLQHLLHSHLTAAGKRTNHVQSTAPTPIRSSLDSLEWQNRTRKLFSLILVQAAILLITYYRHYTTFGPSNG